MSYVNGGNAPPQQLRSEWLQLLSEGISLVLSRWTALQMAVENEWGGRDSRRKSEQLASDIFSWFSQSKEPFYIDDLENIIDESMVLSFNTEIEDGSVEEVAEELMIMHEEFLQGNYQSIEKLRTLSSGAEAVSQSRREDDSSLCIPTIVMEMHQKRVSPNLQSIRRRLTGRSKYWVTTWSQVVNEEDDDDDESSHDEESDMAVDEPTPRLNLESSAERPADQQKPTETVDADGWSAVPSKGNRGKRH